MRLVLNGGVIRSYVAAVGSILRAGNAYSIGAASKGRFANADFANTPTVGSDRPPEADTIDSLLRLDFILAQQPVAHNLEDLELNALKYRSPRSRKARWPALPSVVGFPSHPGGWRTTRLP